jgi:hypothetical protein
VLQVSQSILHDFTNLVNWWSVQVTKLLIMQSSPASLHFVRLKSKYCRQHPAHKHIQSMVGEASLEMTEMDMQESKAAVLPVPVAVLSKACMGLDCSNTGIVVSNPVRGKDECPLFPVLCCPV